ncbi:type III secretion system inner membrane ring subunit SctD [Variovorax soli]|uniref:Type III secretion system YscD/HrpQ family protein n=1 Tax=Variovorax soli TaxID=376815 RepID=A0ABU1NFY8_9BURK|nr:type III secretion system inner membrane ring subunit SctD [Variovorax soli]MDR6536951.1 type III secretion system YscD/HrpQ family protein [Variovorax soli]
MSGESTGLADAIELRVLHGPQAGARLPLQVGQGYAIGAADTCAIVLGGAQVAQEHARISVDADGISVEPLQGRVLTLTGEEVGPELLPLGTVLQFGFVKITAASVDDEWPDDEALQLRSAPAEAADEEEVEAPVERAVAAPEAQAPVPSRPLGIQRLQLFKRPEPRRYAVLGAAVLLLGVALIVAVQRPAEAVASAVAALPDQVEPGPSPAVTEADDASAVAEVLKDFPTGALEVKHTEGGPWAVQGRLRTDKELQRLRERVSTLRMPVEIKVVLDAERRDAVKRFVQNQHAPGRLELRMEPGSGDVLRILGSASSAAEAAAFPERARAELAAFEPIEFDILRPEQVRERFMDRVREAGLDGKFRVTATEPELELQAVLSPQDRRTWEALFVDFTRHYGSTLKIKAIVEPERDAIAAHVAAVVGGAFPYIVTTSGQRIAPGGALAGNTVVAVRDGEIVLSDGTRFRYGP